MSTYTTQDTQNEKQYSSKLERHVIYLKAIDHTPWKKREKMCFCLFLGLRVTLLLSNNRKPSLVTGYELCCMIYFATKSQGRRVEQSHPPTDSVIQTILAGKQVGKRWDYISGQKSILYLMATSWMGLPRESREHLTPVTFRSVIGLECRASFPLYLGSFQRGHSAQLHFK